MPSDPKPDREAEIRLEGAREYEKELRIIIADYFKQTDPLLSVATHLSLVSDKLDHLRLALKNEVADRDAAVQAALESLASELQSRAEVSRANKYEATELELKYVINRVRSLSTTNALERRLLEARLDERRQIAEHCDAESAAATRRGSDETAKFYAEVAGLVRDLPAQLAALDAQKGPQ